MVFVSADYTSPSECMKTLKRSIIYRLPDQVGCATLHTRRHRSCSPGFECYVERTLLSSISCNTQSVREAAMGITMLRDMELG